MRIAVTGGSGFLGRALLRRLCDSGADQIVTCSRDEQKRAALQTAFGWHPGVKVYAGDVRDRDRLIDMFAGCEAVIHAAARKVVAGHPDEPEEMLKTNVIGTQHVIEAAKRAGCRKVVVVSSDKAVHAINAYGVSKAMAEHLAVNANARTFSHGLRVGCVRYGNVLGSTGSVVVRWRQQLAAGEPLALTSPAMTRFWITEGGAVDLVLGALANLRGGEIVIPRLAAASLATLAEALAGPEVTFAPVTDAPTERGGIRQGGEKLYEELVSSAEARRVLRRGDTYVIPPYQHQDMWDAKPWVGEAMPDGWTYRSDTWEWQASVEQMRGMLDGCADSGGVRQQPRRIA